MSDYIEYNDIKIEGKVRLGASSFSNFYENPRAWYKNNILKDNDFKGNTNTVVGTILHSRIERYWKGLEYIHEEEFNYVEQFVNLPEVNEWEVWNEVERLWSMLQTELIGLPKPTEIEVPIVFEIPTSDKYFIGGSYDALRFNSLTFVLDSSRIKDNIKLMEYLKDENLLP